MHPAARWGDAAQATTGESLTDPSPWTRPSYPCTNTTGLQFRVRLLYDSSPAINVDRRHGCPPFRWEVHSQQTPAGNYQQIVWKSRRTQDRPWRPARRGPQAGVTGVMREVGTPERDRVGSAGDTTNSPIKQHYSAMWWRSWIRRDGLDVITLVAACDVPADATRAAVMPGSRYLVIRCVS